MDCSLCSFSKAVVTPEPAVVAAEVSSTSELHVSCGQHVTFPNHFQVPEALKNGLTFGSFDANFGPKVESVSSFADDNMGASSEASGEASKEPSPRFVNSITYLSLSFCTSFFVLFSFGLVWFCSSYSYSFLFLVGESFFFMIARKYFSISNIFVVHFCECTLGE